MKYFVYCILFTGILINQAYSDLNESSIWIFGNKAAVKFDSIPGEAVPFENDFKLNSIEACAVVTDTSGNLIMYSDGESLWNYKNDKIYSGLWGVQTATQGVSIIRKPGADRQFYLFVTNLGEDERGTFLYEVDFENFPDGKVTTAPTKLLHSEYNFERIEIIKHENKTDYWAILSPFYKDSTGYLIYKIDSSGVKFHKRFLSQMHRNYNIGYLRASPDGSYICNVDFDAAEIEIVRFNNKLGLISDMVHIKDEIFETGAYGAAFSPNSRYLYLTTLRKIIGAGYISRLLQLSVASFFHEEVNANIIYNNLFQDSVGTLWAASNASNGKIYISANNKKHLSVINDPNSGGASCDFQYKGPNVTVDNDYARYGLPNNSSGYKTPDYETVYITVCSGDDFYYELPFDTTYSKFHWVGRNYESNSNKIILNDLEEGYFNIFEYKNKTTGEIIFAVALRVKKRNNIDIEAIPSDTVCHVNEVQLRCKESLDIYEWSTGDTSRAIKVTESGTYTLIGRNEVGCPDTVSIDIQIRDPIDVEILGNDTIRCNSPTRLYTKNEYYKYEWSTGSHASEITVDRYGVYIVKAYVSEKCFGYDTLIVYEEEFEEMNLFFENGLLICNDDIISAEVTNPKDYLEYKWSDGTSGISNSFTEPGNYYVEAVNEKYNCYEKYEFEVISEDDFELDLSYKFDCDNFNSYIVANADTNSFNFFWSTGSEEQEINITEAGTYYLNLVSKTGCEFTDSINIKEIIEEYDSLELNFLDGKFFCENDTLNVEIENPQGSFRYLWSNDKVGITNEITEPGIYYVEAINEDFNCYEKYVFEIISEDDFDLSLEYTYDCKLSKNSISSNADTSNFDFQWSTGSNKPVIDIYEEGLYYLTVTTKTGCELTDSIYIDNLSEIEYTLEAIPNDTTCQGKAVTLKFEKISDNIITHFWSTGSREESIEVTSSGEYYVKIKKDDGCHFYDTINVEIIEPFDVSIESNKGDTVCNGEQVLLSLNGLESLSNYEFNWSNGSNNPSIAVKEAGEYSVVVSYKGSDCKDSATFTLHTLPSPEFEITGNTEICEGQSTELFIDDYSDDIDYTWSNNSNEQSIIVDKPGEYWVKAENSIGCATYDTIRVEEYELPEVNISGNFVLCEGDTATISTDNEFADYKWSNGATTREIKVTEAGEYFVEVTNENGCSAESEPVTVEVNSIDFSLESDLYDFGKVYRSESRDTTIYLYNNSDEPVTVLINGKEEVIESGEFPISYSLDNSTTGEKQDFITIKITEPCEAEYQIEIRAEVYAKVTLSTIDVHTEIGEYETIPFYIESESILEDKEFEITTHIDEDLFFTNDSYTVSGSIDISPSNSEFHSITGQIMLAENREYEITFPEINFSDEYIEWDTLNGTITFDLICLHDLRVVHVVQPTEITTSPNPVNDILNIDISTGEEGNFNLELYSSEGRKVYSNSWNQSGDRKELHIDSKQIPSGVYQLRLRTEGHLYKKQVVIVK